MKIPSVAVVLLCLVPSTILGAQAPNPPPITIRAGHLGTRCEGRTRLDDAWRVVYAALATPGDPGGDPALATLQDSVERVLNADPDDLDTRFLLASILGARSEVNHGQAKLEWAGAMEAEVRRILERSPEHPGARHLMGRLHAAVRRMSGLKRFLARTLFGGDVLAGGSWETAKAHLEAAERAAPCVPDHHYELARLYLDLEMPREAATELRHTLEIAGLRDDYGAVARKAMALLRDVP